MGPLCRMHHYIDVFHVLHSLKFIFPCHRCCLDIGYCSFLCRGSFVVLDSSGMRRYSPTVMTGEGKAETRKAMETMQMRGKPMLVTNPGVVLAYSRY